MTTPYHSRARQYSMAVLLIGFLAIAQSVQAAGEAKSKELELNWKIVNGVDGVFKLNEVSQNLPSSGMMVEMDPGIKIVTAPGLDFGLGVGFFLQAGSIAFEHTPGSGLVEQWDAKVFHLGSVIKALYSYEYDAGMVKIAIENGAGIAYTMTRLEWNWEQAANPDIHAGSSQDEDLFHPWVDFALKLDIPVGENDCLGLALSLMMMPVLMDNYTLLRNTGFGLNYQVAF